jgi:glycerol-3-phosphate dehydrogenase (NAD(P)+)
MALRNSSDKMPVGVIGAGSFGTAIANLLAENGPVIIYARRTEVIEKLNAERVNRGQKMHPNVIGTSDIEHISSKCSLIFPSVPSNTFRQMMFEFAPFLQPDHILIHCTKGFDVGNITEQQLLDPATRLRPSNIFTMSEVIRQESNILRVGCLSGPNLSGEIANLQPAATVIASRFDEVVREGQAAIRSQRFQPYASQDLIGVELGGILKNTMAIAAGGLKGLGYGQNALSFLISRGLGEIIRLGGALGAEKEAFLGLAGIGDLVATCSSDLSRNHTVGRRIAAGEKLADIIASSDEVAEGIKTVSICKKLAEYLGVRLPIIETIYRVLFEDLEAAEGLGNLMKYRWGTDVDFM